MNLDYNKTTDSGDKSKYNLENFILLPEFIDYTEGDNLIPVEFRYEETLEDDIYYLRFYIEENSGLINNYPWVIVLYAYSPYLGVAPVYLIPNYSGDLVQFNFDSKTGKYKITDYDNTSVSKQGKISDSWNSIELRINKSGNKIKYLKIHKYSEIIDNQYTRLCDNQSSDSNNPYNKLYQILNTNLLSSRNDLSSKSTIIKSVIETNDRHNIKETLRYNKFGQFEVLGKEIDTDGKLCFRNKLVKINK